MKAFPLAGALGILGFSLHAAGQTTGNSAVKPVPPSSGASARALPAPSLETSRGSAIHRLATDIARDIGAVPSGALVVASPIASDLATPRGDELAARIATQVAGRLDGAKAHGSPATLAVARGLSGRAASLVYLKLEISKGALRVTADLYPVVSNSWERLLNPATGPRAHAFASASLDAEIRGFLPPVLLEQAKVHKFRHDEGEVLAVGCGDIDHDGGNELVLVTRSRICIAKVKANKLAIERAASWTKTAPRVAVPLREPLASIVVSPPDHPGEIFVGTTDHGGVVLNSSLSVVRKLTGLPIAGSDGDACAIRNAESSTFEGAAIGCELPATEKTKPKGRPLDAVVKFTPVVARYDAIAALDAIGKEGETVQVTAVREPSGKLHVSSRNTKKASTIDFTEENAGAQLALADLDLDGTSEIVTTTEAADDALIVSSLTRDGSTVRLRLPAKEGVRAIGICPAEDRGVPALVAAVGTEVWIVR